MKKIVILCIVCGLAVIAGYSLRSKAEPAKTSNLLLANVEALAGGESWLEEWWDSKTHACQKVEVWEYKCMPYREVEKGDWEINIGGTFEPDDVVCGYFKVWDTECVSGTEVAHCWECE